LHQAEQANRYHKLRLNHHYHIDKLSVPPLHDKRLSIGALQSLYFRTIRPTKRHTGASYKGGGGLEGSTLVLQRKKRISQQLTKNVGLGYNYIKTKALIYIIKIDGAQ